MRVLTDAERSLVARSRALSDAEARQLQSIRAELDSGRATFPPSVQPDSLVARVEASLPKIEAEKSSASFHWSNVLAETATQGACKPPAACFPPFQEVSRFRGPAEMGARELQALGGRAPYFGFGLPRIAWKMKKNTLGTDDLMVLDL